MSGSSQDPFEELRKISENRNRKFKFAGRTIAYLYLILCFGIGILIFRELGEGIELYRVAIIFIIAIGFSFLSIWIQKKNLGTEDYSTSMKFIRLIITLLMFLTIYIAIRLTSNI